MSASPLHLYAEDDLCADLGESIARHASPDVTMVRRVTGGVSKARTDLPKYASIANHRPVLVIVDLDRYACPHALLEDWRLASYARPGLAFRIAVRECESWLMADEKGAAEYFGVPVGTLPPDPDSLPNPKEHFLTLLRRKSRGRRKILDDVLPAPGSRSKVGLGYGVRLREFVSDSWSPARASDRSESLTRAIARVRVLLR